MPVVVANETEHELCAGMHVLWCIHNLARRASHALECQAGLSLYQLIPGCVHADSFETAACKPYHQQAATQRRCCIVSCLHAVKLLSARVDIAEKV